MRRSRIKPRKPNFKPGAPQAEKRNKPRSRIIPCTKTVYGRFRQRLKQLCSNLKERSSYLAVRSSHLAFKF